MCYMLQFPIVKLVRQIPEWQNREIFSWCAKVVQNDTKREQWHWSTSIYVFFLSTINDTTVFSFEGLVDGKRDVFIINKDTDLGTRLFYAEDALSIDSCKCIYIRHSISFNAVGNAVPFYATVCKLAEEDLPMVTFPGGVLTISIPVFYHGGA